MGYYVTLTDENFRIPNTPEVLAALHALAAHDELKSGSSWSPGQATKHHFAWGPTENFPADCTSVAEVFRGLGFDVEDQDTEVILTGYDNKSGDERHFVEAVAPFMPNGAYLQWSGEDDYLWREVVKDGAIKQIDATITWEEV